MSSKKYLFQKINIYLNLEQLSPIFASEIWKVSSTNAVLEYTFVKKIVDGKV
jgi:hypothetical protein